MDERLTPTNPLATVRDSAAYAEGRSPERLARLPDIPWAARLLPQIIWSLFVLAALGMLVVMGSALPHVTRAGRAVLIAALLVPLGFSMLGAALLLRLRHKIAAFDRADLLVRPAKIVAKYSGIRPHGPGGLAGGHWISVELEDGSHQTLETLSAKLYERVGEQHCGVLYSRDAVAVDFDRVS